MLKSGAQEFRFRKTDTVGAPAAEDDAEFLKACYVDTGDVKLLADINDIRLIVLGRTGSGKSALLKELEESMDGAVIRVSPEQLALTYVSKSSILNFFASIGVNVEPFFKLLWRHVLTVELLAHHFRNDTSAADTPLLEKVKQRFMGTAKRDRDVQDAANYLQQWGQSFWKDTEYRVKEVTSQIESKLDAQAKVTLGPKAAAIAGAVSAGDRFSDTERTELVSRGQEIISGAQVQDLRKIFTMLDSVLDDRKSQYYVVIDNLDEDWVEERFRYKLIMSLIQTARSFNDVRNAKVILALRRDLIDRVFLLARDTGFQEEKFQALYLPLVWTRSQILEILDRRINHLVSRQYTKARVTHEDLMPTHFRGLPIGDYIYSIARRPRDVIAFFNTCIKAAPEEPRVDADRLTLAEGDYSRNRLRALGEEWFADHPILVDLAKLILAKRPSTFTIGDVGDAELEALCLQFALEHQKAAGPRHPAFDVAIGQLKASEYKPVLFQTFYHVGLIGLKLSLYDAESWADETGRSISFAEISDDIGVVVHPAYRRALGIGDVAP